MFKFYKHTLAARINDLLMGVIALGILVVAIEYIQIGTSLRNFNDVHNLLQRLVLLLLVVFFACYILIAYSAYWDATPEIEQELNVASFDELSSSRIIVIFLLDIIQVALVACMVGTMLVGDLTNFRSIPPSPEVSLDLNLIDFAFLFALAFAWHTVIVIWYSIRDGGFQIRSVHTGYLGIYLVLFTGILIMAQWEDTSWHRIVEWMLTIIFGTLIGTLFVIKGKSDLERAARQLSSHS